MIGQGSAACGHDPAQFVTADEGTGYCPACEDEARAAATNDKLGPDTSAADVDGARSPAGPQRHHESVGERQGRQPAQERPAAYDEDPSGSPWDATTMMADEYGIGDLDVIAAVGSARRGGGVGPPGVDIAGHGSRPHWTVRHGPGGGAFDARVRRKRGF